MFLMKKPGVFDEKKGRFFANFDEIFSPNLEIELIRYGSDWHHQTFWCSIG
jgi:hypothetical protein